MIVDNVYIDVKAGNGGSGLVSFRKAKFQPFGGPDGGDGGKGGDIYMVADSGLRDLSSFKHKRFFQAGDGSKGGSNKKHGSDAKDLFIKVPIGTLVYVKEDGSQRMLADLDKDGEMVTVAEGGKGGKGNVHFATATRKAPEIAQKGAEGKHVRLFLHLILPVDVAMIGLPNVGKSTLLSAVSGARPIVAEYPFSTREPILGMVDLDMKPLIWAEIPAIIPGSHEGKGLGNRQLSHSERAKVLIYLVDISDDTAKDKLKYLHKEIEIFNQGLGNKKSVIVLNKADLVTDSDEQENIMRSYESFGLPVYLVSAKQGTGLDQLVSVMHSMVDTVATAGQEDISPMVILRPEPVDKRRAS